MHAVVRLMYLLSEQRSKVLLSGLELSLVNTQISKNCSASMQIRYLLLSTMLVRNFLIYVMEAQRIGIRCPAVSSLLCKECVLVLLLLLTFTVHVVKILKKYFTNI